MLAADQLISWGERRLTKYRISGMPTRSCRQFKYVYVPYWPWLWSYHKLIRFGLFLFRMLETEFSIRINQFFWWKYDSAAVCRFRGGGTEKGVDNLRLIIPISACISMCSLCLSPNSNMLGILLLTKSHGPGTEKSCPTLFMTEAQLQAKYLYSCWNKMPLSPLILDTVIVLAIKWINQFKWQ